MASKEYYEGRDFEHNNILFENLEKELNVTNLVQDGSSGTKADILGKQNGKEIGLSCKNVGGDNTQADLTTVNSFCEFFPSVEPYRNMLLAFFGTKDGWSDILEQYKDVDLSEYDTNRYSHVAHKRINAHHIKEFNLFIDELNQLTKSGKLHHRLLKSLNKGKPVDYLIWRNKKTTDCHVLHIDTFLRQLKKSKWQITKGGTVIECILDGDKVFFLQMKGSKIKINKIPTGEYDHSMQFHINLPNPEIYSVTSFNV